MSGGWGVPKSAEHRAKIAAAHRGLSAPYIGLRRTPEHCANLSRALKGKPKTPEAIAAAYAARFRNKPPAWIAGATPEEIAAAAVAKGEARRKILSKCARRAKHGQTARRRANDILADVEGRILSEPDRKVRSALKEKRRKLRSALRCREKADA